jgi:hypothetical protein
LTNPFQNLVRILYIVTEIPILKHILLLYKSNLLMSNSQSISPLLHDEVEIIDFLVDNNAMIKDFSRSQLTWFFVEENFHIILFLAEGEKTRFERYIVECFSENMNDMIALWNKFDQRIQASQEVRVMKLAKNKVHDLIAMSETFQALFGRRDFEEE